MIPVDGPHEEGAGPIAGIEMLTVAWSAINRVTTGGEELGPEHRITPFEGLRAITADAAWQNREEDRQGTLQNGKLADLVVLLSTRSPPGRCSSPTGSSWSTGTGGRRRPADPTSPFLCPSEQARLEGPCHWFRKGGRS